MTGLPVARVLRLRGLRAVQKRTWEAYLDAGYWLYTPEAKAARAAWLNATEAVIECNIHQPATNQEKQQ